MAYREAKTEKEKAKGKSTDELSFDEALTFFKKRGKSKGASKFRWRGNVYDLSGSKVSSSTKKDSSPKSTIKPEVSSTAPEKSKRPMRRTGKLSDDAKASRTNDGDTSVRTSSGPNTRNGPAKNKAPNEAATKLLRSKGLTYDQWEAMSRMEREEKGLPKTTMGWQNQDLMNDPIAWMKKQLGLTAKTPSTGSRDRKNFNKGGMVKSGNTDYKKSGMFYKSGSPKGFK